MSRIVAGAARGRRLATPAGRDTRPTSDRVREALFSSIEATVGALEGQAFLDIYAGSGAVGLEALSRGANPVVLVEQDRRAAAVIRQNIGALKDLPGAKLEVIQAERFATKPAASSYAIVFLDPPYALATERIGEVLTGLAVNGRLDPDAMVIVERATRDGEFVWPDGFEPDKQRRYGDTTLWFATWQVASGQFASRKEPRNA